MVSSRRGEGLIFPKARPCDPGGLAGGLSDGWPGAAGLLSGRPGWRDTPLRAGRASRPRPALLPALTRPASVSVFSGLPPQGGWETDETVAEAAARESLEEAGVRGELQARGVPARRLDGAPRGSPLPDSAHRRSWARSTSPASRVAASPPSSSCSSQRHGAAEVREPCAASSDTAALPLCSGAGSLARTGREATLLGAFSLCHIGYGR